MNSRKRARGVMRDSQFSACRAKEVECGICLESAYCWDLRNILDDRVDKFVVPSHQPAVFLDGCAPSATHLFHLRCVYQWMLLKSQCPLCRETVTRVLLKSDTTAKTSIPAQHHPAVKERTVSTTGATKSIPKDFSQPIVSVFRRLRRYDEHQSLNRHLAVESETVFSGIDREYVTLFRVRAFFAPYLDGIEQLPTCATQQDVRNNYIRVIPLSELVNADRRPLMPSPKRRQTVPKRTSKMRHDKTPLSNIDRSGFNAAASARSRDHLVLVANSTRTGASLSYNCTGTQSHDHRNRMNGVSGNGDGECHTKTERFPERNTLKLQCSKNVEFVTAGNTSVIKVHGAARSAMHTSTSSATILEASVVDDSAQSSVHKQVKIMLGRLQKISTAWQKHMSNKVSCVIDSQSLQAVVSYVGLMDVSNAGSFLFTRSEDNQMTVTMIIELLCTALDLSARFMVKNTAVQHDGKQCSSSNLQCLLAATAKITDGIHHALSQSGIIPLASRNGKSQMLHSRSNTSQFSLFASPATYPFERIENDRSLFATLISEKIVRLLNVLSSIATDQSTTLHESPRLSPADLECSALSCDSLTLEVKQQALKLFHRVATRFISDPQGCLMEDRSFVCSNSHDASKKALPHAQGLVSKLLQRNVQTLDESSLKIYRESSHPSCNRNASCSQELKAEGQDQKPDETQIGINYLAFLERAARRHVNRQDPRMKALLPVSSNHDTGSLLSILPQSKQFAHPARYHSRPNLPPYSSYVSMVPAPKHIAGKVISTGRATEAIDNALQRFLKEAGSISTPLLVGQELTPFAKKRLDHLISNS